MRLRGAELWVFVGALERVQCVSDVVVEDYRLIGSYFPNADYLCLGISGWGTNNFKR